QPAHSRTAEHGLRVLESAAVSWMNLMRSGAAKGRGRTTDRTDRRQQRPSDKPHQETGVRDWQHGPTPPDRTKHVAERWRLRGLRPYGHGVWSSLQPVHGPGSRSPDLVRAARQLRLMPRPKA